MNLIPLLTSNFTVPRFICKPIAMASASMQKHPAADADFNMHLSMYQGTRGRRYS